MYWNEGDSSVAVMPTAEPAKSMQPSWCTGGNPQMGQNATQVTADWANTITAEMADMVTAANVTLDKTKNNQVRIANNMRGWFTWDADTDYTGEKSFCLGTDGIPYRAVQDSGPNTEAGYIDPVQDTAGAYWQTLASWINGAGSLPPIDPEMLQTNFYIRTDGDDSNDGLEDNAEHAFRTLQGAVDKYLFRYKASPYPVYFRMTMAGEYGPCNIDVAKIGNGVYVYGIDGNQDAVTLTSNNPNYTFRAQNGKCDLKNIKLVNTLTSGSVNMLITDTSSSRITNITIQSYHNQTGYVRAFASAAAIVEGNIKYIGKFDSLFTGGAGHEMRIAYQNSVTIDYSSAQASYFCNFLGPFTYLNFIRSRGITFVGTSSNIATKYNLYTKNILDTHGGGAGYFPGTAAGNNGTDSVYL